MTRGESGEGKKKERFSYEEKKKSEGLSTGNVSRAEVTRRADRSPLSLSLSLSLALSLSRAQGQRRERCSTAPERLRSPTCARVLVGTIVREAKRGDAGRAWALKWPLLVSRVLREATLRRHVVPVPVRSRGSRELKATVPRAGRLVGSPGDRGYRPPLERTGRGVEYEERKEKRARTSASVTLPRRAAATS